MLDHYLYAENTFFTLETKRSYMVIGGSPMRRETFLLSSEGYRHIQVTVVGLRDHAFKRSWNVCYDIPDRSYDLCEMCVDSSTGHLFIVDTEHDSVHEMTSSGELIRILTFYGLREPLAIAIDPHRRRLYISDLLGYLHVISLVTVERVEKLRMRHITNLNSLFFDVSSGLLVAVSSREHRVLVLDPEARLLIRAFGRFGSQGHQLYNPDSAIVSAGEVLVADSGNKDVKVFSLSDGKYLYSFKHPNMSCPTRMYRDAVTGYLYVLDGLKNSIFVFE